jgi:hypothetical protein
MAGDTELEKRRADTIRAIAAENRRYDKRRAALQRLFPPALPP